MHGEEARLQERGEKGLSGKVKQPFQVEVLEFGSVG
jgi:hypothetical protein